MYVNTWWTLPSPRKGLVHGISQLILLLPELGSNSAADSNKSTCVLNCCMVANAALHWFHIYPHDPSWKQPKAQAESVLKSESPRDFKPGERSSTTPVPPMLDISVYTTKRGKRFSPDHLTHKISLKPSFTSGWSTTDTRAKGACFWKQSYLQDGLAS